MTATPKKRAYTSPLRAEQAAGTRDRIIDAAVALLQDNDLSAFTMQDVADQAAVAVRTVYRAFPTKDDLIAGVLDAIRQRFEASAGEAPTSGVELQASVPGAVHAVFELEPLYRALFATASGRELHRATARDRSGAVGGAFADGLDGLDERKRRLVMAMLHLVTSSKSVLWLADYAGLDADETTNAITWALAALVDAARTEAGR